MMDCQRDLQVVMDEFIDVHRRCVFWNLKDYGVMDLQKKHPAYWQVAVCPDQTEVKQVTDSRLGDISNR